MPPEGTVSTSSPNNVTWLAPAWADKLALDPGTMHHSWDHPAEIPVRPMIDGQPDMVVAVSADVEDVITVTDGQISVARAETMIYVGDLVMSLSAALQLAEALQSTVSRVEGDWGPAQSDEWRARGESAT